MNGHQLTLCRKASLKCKRKNYFLIRYSFIIRFFLNVEASSLPHKFRRLKLISRNFPDKKIRCEGNLISHDCFKEVMRKQNLMHYDDDRGDISLFRFKISQSTQSPKMICQCFIFWVFMWCKLTCLFGYPLSILGQIEVEIGN